MGNIDCRNFYSKERKSNEKNFNISLDFKNKQNSTIILNNNKNNISISSQEIILSPKEINSILSPILKTEKSKTINDNNLREIKLEKENIIGNNKKEKENINQICINNNKKEKENKKINQTQEIKDNNKDNNYIRRKSTLLNFEHRRMPIEIIDEYEREKKKCSFDKNYLNNNNNINQSNIKDNDNNNSFINNNVQQLNINLNQFQNNIQNYNYYIQNNYTNINIPQNIVNNYIINSNINQFDNLKTHDYKNNNIKKKKIEKKNCKKKEIIHWKKLNIKNIIPLEKITKVYDNTILLNGNFNVYSRETILNKNLETTLRFIILTRSELKIYRSKEAKLFQKNPLRRISLFNISKCDLYNKKNPKINNKNFENKFNFFIELVTVNKMVNTDENSIINHEKNNKRKYNYKINYNNNKNNNSQKRKKKISYLIDLSLENGINKSKNYMSKNSNNYDKNYDILIFSSDDEQLINQWVTVINYFINY